MNFKIEIENNVCRMSEDSEISVVAIDAPSSTADNHHSRDSGSGDHPEIEKPDTWKVNFHNRAIQFKSNWLQKQKWKKLLEVFSLSCVILIVCMVFIIPTIIFALTPTTTNEVCCLHGYEQRLPIYVNEC